MFDWLIVDDENAFCVDADYSAGTATVTNYGGAGATAEFEVVREDMDREKLLKLVAKIDAAGKSNDTETVLTLDEYFDGNTETYSNLCANTGRSPSAEELREFLRRIEQRDGVAHVLIRVYDYQDALESDDYWINTDTVFLVTNVGLNEIKTWFDPLMYSEVYEEKDLTNFNNLPPIPAGHRVVGVWWD